MTDPMNAPTTSPPPAPPPASVTPTAASPMSGMLTSMTQTELMIAGGAALIVITGLVFMVFNGYYVSDVIWGGAAIALVAVLWHRRMPAGMAANYEWLLIGMSAFIGLLAVRTLLGDLVYIATPPAGLTVPRLIGMVGFYVGATLMAFGAWQLWSRRTA